MLKHLFVATIIFLALFGCSGSESGGTGTSNPSGDAATSLNAELKGYIWTAKRGEIFDIERGVTINLSDDGDVYPSRDGSEYIEHISEHRTDFSDEGCVNSFDPYVKVDLFNFRDTKTGAIKSTFETKFQVTGPIRMSPDGETMITYAIDPFDCENSHLVFPTVMNRNGEVIIRGLSNLISFDWLPNNLLVATISKGDGIYKLLVEKERNTFGFKTVSTLDNIIGSPRHLRVSLDGKSVLFEGVTGGNQFLSGVKYRNATVYKIDIDGDNLEQIVDASRTGDKRVNQPLWSPDGSKILVTENYTSGASVTIYGSEDVTSVVTSIGTIPASRNSLTYSISRSEGKTILPPDIYTETVRPIFTVRDGNLVGKFFDPLTHLNWTKTIREQ